MALFKISKGRSENLPTNKVDGYCYVTINDHKFYVDYTKDDGTLDRFALNAVTADIAHKLGTTNIGNSSKPIYLEKGTPQACVDFLPLSAGESKKIIGPLGLTENVNYGTSLPDEGFVGQIFFLENGKADNGPSLPIGGTAGQVLTKNSSVDGDASWTTDIAGNAATATKATQDGNGNVISSTYLPLSAGENSKLTGPLGLSENINYGTSLPDNGFDGQLFFLEDDSPSLPTGGTTGQVLVKNSSTDGDASWATDISGNAATSTKLATARAIFGQSFDGTTNVAGKPWVYGTYTSNAEQRFGNSGIEIRENGLVGNTQSDIGYAPSIGFHWSGKIAATMLFHNDGNFYLRKQDGTSRASLDANLIGNAATATTAAKLSRDGNTAYPMTFNWSGQDGQPSWLWGGNDGTNMYVYNPSNFSVNYAAGAGAANALAPRNDITYGWNGLQYFNANLAAGNAAGANDTPTADWYHIIRMNHGNGAGYYFDIASCFHNDNMYFKRVDNGNTGGWKHIWVQGNSVTGAVWNDYAECRESDCEEFGYVLMETGDDSLTKTTERLSHFAGVSSDTWGFSQGETEKAKMPIAVAGRVLVYTYQDRNNYKPGDCVCAAPGGTVDIMTREEVREWPDRIVGTVSCVPDYEEWGGGEGADRDPVKVNGRIWIKVR